MIAAVGHTDAVPQGTRRHVLIVVENLPVPFDRRVWMEATALVEEGFRVSVICPRGEHHRESYERIDGIEIFRHRLPAEHSSAFGYIREYTAALGGEIMLAARIWRGAKLDIVHICNPPDLLFLVALPFKLGAGAALIYDQHDLVPEMYEAKYGRRDVFYWTLRVMERLTYALADVVITTNESQRAVVLTRGRLSADRIFLVRSGPDLSTFVAGETSEGPPLGDRRYRVGYVGIMGEPEGLDLLLRVIHEIVVNRGRRDISFILIGDGPMLENLLVLAAELHLRDFVEFTGRLPSDQMIPRLLACDVCVNPDPYTPYNDSCSMNKIMEYMALGLPMVQFDLTEGRRLAGPASLYVTPNNEREFADSILILLESPELAGRMGAAGKRRMEDLFEWRHQKPTLLRAYHTVLHLNMPPRAERGRERLLIRLARGFRR